LLILIHFKYGNAWSKQQQKCHSKVCLAHGHITKADRCVGKVGSSLQYDHRLAVGRNFKGTGSRQYVWGQEPCRSSLAWPQSSVRAEEQERRSSQMYHAQEAPKQTAEIRKLMLPARTARAKTSCTAPRKYRENTERYGDRKCPTYAQLFNVDVSSYPADVPTTVSVTPHSQQHVSVTTIRSLLYSTLPDTTHTASQSQNHGSRTWQHTTTLPYRGISTVLTTNSYKELSAIYWLLIATQVSAPYWSLVATKNYQQYTDC
jgi:hypothetical protein